MKTLRRIDLRDHPIFVTAVTQDRHPLLLRRPTLFLDSWRLAQPEAWVLMPDHFHVIITPCDHSISDIIRDFKMTYWYAYRKLERDGRVWQHRFYDHIIRNQEEMNMYMDYIHSNPVHHKQCGAARDWKHSSFRNWVTRGCYELDWRAEDDLGDGEEFGE